MIRIFILFFITFSFQNLSAQGVSYSLTPVKGISNWQEIKHKAADFTGVSAYTHFLDYPATLTLEMRDAQGSITQIHLQPQGEHPTPGRQAFEGQPVYFNPTHFRLLSNGDIPIVVRLFFSGEPHSPEKDSQPQTEVNCSCPYPEFCNRICWCPDGNCPEDATPTFSEVTHLVIHHSAGFNNAADYSQVVRYYWDLHVNTNGWDDIAYNWLIDPNGLVYEGRKVGAIGAHFSCMNRGTSGICLIGDFQSRYPSPAQIQKTISLLAAENCYFQLNPTEITFHPSSALNLHENTSHRDGNPSPAPNSCATGTICPGDSLYALLPDIRSSIQSLPCFTTGISDLLVSTATAIWRDDKLHIYSALKISSVEMYNMAGQRFQPLVFSSSENLYILSNIPTSKGLYLLRFDPNLPAIKLVKE